MLEVNLVLILGLLLTAGFAVAQLAKRLGLPSVSGYIVAGILLGPSVLGIVGEEISPPGLHVFTEIALLLVAFGIGERFDLQQLSRSARALTRISLGETAMTFLLVAGGVYFVAASGAVGGILQKGDLLSLGIISGAVAIATAPATTVAVIRETGASGPVSRLVLSSVVVNNAVSVTLFGMMMAVSKTLMTEGQEVTLIQFFGPWVRTAASLALGGVFGFVVDLLVHRISKRDEVLLAALATLLFCGGMASLLGLSSLLAGVAAGFSVVNRDRRDVRAFRALNDFEPPLYGIFFALAGAQLHLSDLASTGMIGIVFVAARLAGKYFGAWWGASSAGLLPEQSRVIGLGLLPQAGLAIALAYLIGQESALGPIQSMLMNAVITSVIINELIGPPLVRLMASRASELPDEKVSHRIELAGIDTVDVEPWTGPSLQPTTHPQGYVLFGVRHPGTVAGVTRLATLLSHQYHSIPAAVHVLSSERTSEFWKENEDREGQQLFRLAEQEAESIGYPLKVCSEFAAETAEGILRVTEALETRAIVLGHPFARRAPTFSQVVDMVARESYCPVTVVKFSGTFSTRKVLVPVSFPEELLALKTIISAVSTHSTSEVTLLRLHPSETSPKELGKSKEELTEICSNWKESLDCQTIAADSRMHCILEISQDFDLVVMSAGGRRGLRRVFFGSLAEDVALRIHRTMLLVSGSDHRAFLGL